MRKIAPATTHCSFASPRPALRRQTISSSSRGSRVFVRLWLRGGLGDCGDCVCASCHVCWLASRPSKEKNISRTSCIIDWASSCA